MICTVCGAERKLYHPCPVCGQPTFRPPEPEPEPHRIDIEAAWDDFIRTVALVDEKEAADFLAVIYAWKDEQLADALPKGEQ